MSALRALGRLTRSLYARLAVVFLASLLVMSLATAWFAVDQFDQLGREWLQRTQLHLASHLADSFRQPLLRGPNSGAAREAAQRIKRINPALSIYVLNARGRVVGTYGRNQCALGDTVALSPVHKLLSKMPMLPVYTGLPCHPGRNVFSAAHIAYGPNHVPGYLLVVLEANTHMSMVGMWQTSSISRSLAVAGIAALLLSGGVGLLLFALLTRRFSRLTRAVQRFAAGDYGLRIPATADDEIGRATQAFNDMAATIEVQVNALRESDRQRRELVANLSHDFRTPLTALQGYAEQLYTETTGSTEQVDAILANVTRLTRLAEQLSLLARVDIAERALHVEPFPLAELAYDIVGKFRPQADAAGVTLSVDCPVPLPVVADIELIDRALSNLVENALRATDPGGHVTLSAERQSDRVRVSVADTGIGIPSHEIGLVTQRFYRTGETRRRGSGSGLGLAIVAEVCARHDTRLDLHSGTGQGTTASFELAVAKRAATR